MTPSLGRVAGVQTPAFVERCRTPRGASYRRGVAGVQTPAFVERFSAPTTVSRAMRVSPEFRLRPSLSVHDGLCDRERDPGVAGVQTPAFVERPTRMSLAILTASRVAGVQTPAFVERLGTIPSFLVVSCVAGVQTPAFVERPGGCRRPSASGVVSPEFRLRPSLSVAQGAGVSVHQLGVAGVQTPAFVERFSISVQIAWKM